MRGCREDYATALVESAIFQTSTPPAVFRSYVAGEFLFAPVGITYLLCQFYTLIFLQV